MSLAFTPYAQPSGFTLCSASLQAPQNLDQQDRAILSWYALCPNEDPITGTSVSLYHIGKSPDAWHDPKRPNPQLPAPLYQASGSANSLRQDLDLPDPDKPLPSPNHISHAWECRMPVVPPFLCSGLANTHVNQGGKKPSRKVIDFEYEIPFAVRKSESTGMARQSTSKRL